MFPSCLYLCLQERVVLFTHRAHGGMTDLHEGLVLQRINQWCVIDVIKTEVIYNLFKVSSSPARPHDETKT